MLLRRNSDKVDVLQKVPLFSGLSRGNLGSIARAADEVQVDAGRLLARQGGLGQEFALILDGRVRVERNGQTIARLGSGDFFGELSLIDGRPRVASVIAETPTSLLVVHRRSFGALLEDIPRLRKRIMVALCERLREADTALAAKN